MKSLLNHRARSPDQRVLIKPLKPPRLLPLKQWIFSKPHMGPGKFIRALNFNYFPLSPPPSLLRSAPPQPKLPILRNSTFLPSADPVLGSHKIYCVLWRSVPFSHHVCGFQIKLDTPDIYCSQGFSVFNK